MENLEVKRGGKQRFAIGEDTDLDGNIVANILWVPHVDYHHHDHIDLTVKEAKRLAKWLKNFVKKHEG